MKKISEIWDIYRGCWSDANATQRIEKLQKIITDDFEYKDPDFEVKGSVQLSDYMRHFQEEYKGASFATVNMNMHHNRCLVHWNMINENKEVISKGISYVLYENDKLKEITGFFQED